MWFLQAVNGVIDFLSGKKSYIVGVIMILMGLYQSNNDLMMQGLAIITLRAGISKVNQ